MSENIDLQEKEAPEVVETQKAKASDVESTRGETFVAPRVDIYESDNDLVLTADVPGTAKGGVDLKLEDGVLQVTAHRTTTVKDPVYSELRNSSYYRAFSLSDEIDSEGISAELKDGVLTVTLPKSAKAKPRTIEVKAE